MLYLTTRNSQEAYTAHRAITENIAPDGGLYIPFKLPVYNEEQLARLAEGTFCQIVAHVLNQFFPCRLSAWDVEVCIGRNPAKLDNVGRKTVISEAWHNPGGCYEYVVNGLNELITAFSGVPVSDWSQIAIHIAFIFGLYAELRRNALLENDDVFDFSAQADNLCMPVAILYAKQMGLPIGKIILCSEDNKVLWDLVNHGQMSISQLQPENRAAMERMIHALLGQNAAIKYMQANQRLGVYDSTEEQAQKINDQLFAAVIGADRIGAVSCSVQNTYNYLLAPDAAACYAAIQDYRAQTGQGRLAVLMGIFVR